MSDSNLSALDHSEWRVQMKRDGHKEIPKETKSFLIYLCAPVSLEFNAEYN